MPSDSLTKLEPRHLAAARLKAMGKTHAQISAEVGVEVRTLAKWFSSQLMKDEVSRLLGAADELFVEQMAGAAFAGIKALVDMLELPTATNDEGAISADVKREVAMELLDRVPQTAKVGAEKGAGGGNLTVNNLTAVFEGMNDADLAEYIGRWKAGGQPDLEGHAAPALERPES